MGNSENLEDLLGELCEAETTDPSPAFPGYSVIAEVGRGGFGAVYRARDERLGRDVALKVLLPPLEGDAAARERFLSEARNLARLRHPHVLAIHAVLEHQGRVALVTEFIDGQPLSDLLRDRGTLSAREAAQVGVEVLRALAAVHQAGIVHRDVKTPNILREKGGRIILADFGLGVFLSEGRDLRTCGFLAGSPLFMAPEQVVGKGVDRRTDLYAAGIVLYNLSSGKFPVTASDLGELFAKIEAGDLVSLRDRRPDLPEGFIRVVRKALSARQDDRFQSAGEMEEALLQFLSEGGGSSRKLAPRRLILAAVVTLCLAPLAALLLSRSGPEPLGAEAGFYLASPGGARPLHDREQLELGSSIYLRFRADAPAHVYVLNESSAGERLVLFPMPGGTLQNPLPGGVLHRLPGVVGGEAMDWRLKTPAEEERLFVFASREPVAEIEELVRNMARPVKGGAPAYAPAGGEAVRAVLRGFGEVAPSAVEATASGAGSMARFVEELKGRGKGVRASDPWVHALTLRGGRR